MPADELRADDVREPARLLPGNRYPAGRGEVMVLTSNPASAYQRLSMKRRRR